MDKKLSVTLELCTALKTKLCSDRIDTQLAVDTLNLAIDNRRKSAGIIFHFDRGAQFTSKCFRKHLDELI